MNKREQKACVEIRISCPVHPFAAYSVRFDESIGNYKENIGRPSTHLAFLVFAVCCKPILAILSQRKHQTIINEVAYLLCFVHPFWQCCYNEHMRRSSCISHVGGVCCVCLHPDKTCQTWHQLRTCRLIRLRTLQPQFQSLADSRTITPMPTSTSRDAS